MPDYLDHGSRHRPGGSDPIPGLASGTGNDWVQAQHPLGTVAASGSATASFVDGDIQYQTDDGSVYAVHAGTVGSIGMLQTGSYLVRAIALFGSGTGTVLVSAVIGGDLTLYDYDVHDGTVGADATRRQAIWEQLCVVNSVTSSAGAYVTFTNNTSGSLVGVTAQLQIFRLT